MLTRRRLAATAAATSAALALPAIGRAQAVTRLTFNYPIAVGGPLQAIIDGYCADYRKETGVEVVPVYSGDYSQTLIKTLAALRAGPGQGPHFAVLLAAEIHSLREAEVILPLEEVGLDTDGAQWLSGFFPAFMLNARAEGKTWSVPFQRSVAVDYFNKQAFEQAGLDPQRFPRTWAELAAAAEKLTVSAENRTSRWGFKLASDLGNAQWTMSALAGQAGQSLANPDGTAVYFNSPGAVRALRFWCDLSRVQKATPPGQTSWAQLTPDFLEGNAAIIQHTTGNLANLRSKASFPFGVAALPGESEPRTVTGGGSLYLFRGTSAAEQAATMRFIRWLTEPARAADWSIRTGYVATRPDAYQTEAMSRFTAEVPAAAQFPGFLNGAVAELSTFGNQRIYKALTDNVQAALTGAKTPETAMADAQSEADRILRPFRRA